jgi:hypothetical protein
LAQRDIGGSLQTADAYSIDIHKFIRGYKKRGLLEVESKASITLLRRKEAGWATLASSFLNVGLVKIGGARIASSSFFNRLSSNWTKTTEIKGERNKNDAQFS